MPRVAALSDAGYEWLANRRKKLVVEGVEKIESFAAAFDRVVAIVNELEAKKV
jgi:hypothetical protein